MTNGRERIALFTCYSPEIGGGGANLRSLIPHLADVEVTWFYLGSTRLSWPNAASLGRPLIGGPAYQDLARSPMLWLGLADRWLAPIAKRILQQGFDGHWVVAMNEGVLIGSRLAELAPEIPLHVTVQDDQEHGIFGRSTRYRWMARLTRAPFRRLVRAARSIDVTSDGMQHYYSRLLGLQTEVVHPIVLSLPKLPDVAREPSRLSVGHIGTVYSASEVRTFLQALKQSAGRLGRRPHAVFIGLARKYECLLAVTGIEFENIPTMPEEPAVQRLAQCDFLYAAYPFDAASRVFTQTSLPTKLTTYVQAQRPILVHAPGASTLAEMVHRFGIGTVCDQTGAADLEKAIGVCQSMAIATEQFKRARETYYGLHNAQTLGRQLRLSH